MMLDASATFLCVPRFSYVCLCVADWLFGRTAQGLLHARELYSVPSKSHCVPVTK